MNWLMWESKIFETDSNWTTPFFKNVFHKMNNSSVENQRFKSHEGTSIFSSLSYSEQSVILTPILLILIINQFINKEKTKGKNNIILTWPKFLNSQTCFVILSYTLFSIAFPVILLTILLSYLNRQVVALFLKNKYGDEFVKILDGTDTIWALEEDNSKSVINVIATVEVQSKNNQNTDGLILERLRRTVSNKFFKNSCPYPKMFYKRSFEKGYFFWKENKNLCVDQFVSSMNVNGSDSEVTEGEFRNFVSEKCNEPMPDDNTASWQILISDKPMKQNGGDENKSTKMYPLLFRIHHTLGDGVVLMKLMLKTIADEDRKLKRQMTLIAPSDELKTSLRQLFEFCDMEKMIKNVKCAIVQFVKVIYVLSLVPMSLMNQSLRPPDENVLHGPPLKGKKICTWISDNYTDESLLLIIKRMKSKIPGATFSDLFLTALSASYYSFFSQCCSLGKPIIPNYLTAVVPVRIEKSDFNFEEEMSKKKLILENRFSIAYLTVPVNPEGSGNENISLLKRLMEIRKETNKLRCSADFYVNYALMSVIGHVFPEWMLRPILYSKQATLIVSNLPGPSSITICGGFPLKDMAFFVPHRGTTGIGVTMFSCSGRVHIGLITDTALISCEEDARSILQGAVEQIKALDTFTSRTLCSQENSMDGYKLEK